MKITKLTQDIEGKWWAQLSYNCGEVVVHTMQEWKDRINRERRVRDENRRLKKTLLDAGLEGESSKTQV